MVSKSSIYGHFVMLKQSIIAEESKLMCQSGRRKRRILKQDTPFEGIPPLMTNCPFIY